MHGGQISQSLFSEVFFWSIYFILVCSPSFFASSAYPRAVVDTTSDASPPAQVLCTGFPTHTTNGISSYFFKKKIKEKKNQQKRQLDPAFYGFRSPLISLHRACSRAGPYVAVPQVPLAGCISGGCCVVFFPQLARALSLSHYLFLSYFLFMFR
ncbi:hypothetical protein M426DRAFT_134330 [Hypoxylon sp. CI-4A]|nr:hypothetical protein M426DRAFT_134330 [Hypoxylon sp. CI-4A]